MTASIRSIATTRRGIRHRKAVVNFTVPGIDNVPDLQGDINDPQTNGGSSPGNQYMVVRDLIKGFRAAHPQYERVFVETLPPEILVEQMERGAVVIGT